MLFDIFEQQSTEHETFHRILYRIQRIYWAISTIRFTEISRGNCGRSNVLRISVPLL